MSEAISDAILRVEGRTEELAIEQLISVVRALRQDRDGFQRELQSARTTIAEQGREIAALRVALQDIGNIHPLVGPRGEIHNAVVHGIIDAALSHGSAAKGEGK